MRQYRPKQGGQLHIPTFVFHLLYHLALVKVSGQDIHKRLGISPAKVRGNLNNGDQKGLKPDLLTNFKEGMGAGIIRREKGEKVKIELYLCG
jgi:hypothetical protein